MQYLKQSTAVTIKLGPFLDDTDGKTAETGLTISQSDIRLSKNGGAFAQTNNATGATHDELGWYGIPADTTDTATLGRLKAAVHKSGALPCFAEFMVVTANVYDSLCSTDVLQSDMTQISGVAQSATDLKDFADTGYDPAAHKVAGVVLADSCTTNTDMVGTDNAALAATALSDAVWTAARAGALTDWINGGRLDIILDIIAADTTTDIPALIATAQADLDTITGTDGVTLATAQALYAPNVVVPDAAGVAATPAEVATALTDINLDHLCKTATAAADMTAEVVDDTIISRILSDGDTSAFDPSTDGLQPIRDRGDAAWTTGAGGSSPTVGEIRTEMEKAGTKLTLALLDTDDLQTNQGAWITATGFSVPSEYDTVIAALQSDLDNPTQYKADVSAIATATALATHDGKLDTVDANVDSILTDTGTTLPARFTGIEGATFDTGTDSNEAIRNRGDSAWTTGAGGSDRLLMVDTTIATLDSQTSFTLTAGSTDDDAYNNCTIVIEDVSTATQKAVGIISDYVGATKTVTLKYDPAIFAMEVTDKVYILAENALKATLANRQLNVAADGDIAGNIDGSVASVVASIAQTGDSYARLGALGAGLTAVPWNSAWDAEVQSECTDALVAYDPPTRGEATTDKDAIITEVNANETKIDTIDTNVDSILVDTGTTLDGKINTIDTNVDSILVDTGTSVPADIAALNDITVADIIAGISEGALDLQEILRVILSATSGKSSGGGTATIVFRDYADTKARITATVDANGNRTAMTLDGV